MNKFQLMGRLTKDPETRYTANTNTQVTTFSLAVNRRFTSQDGERQTDFFNIVAYGKLAEFCSKYYKKGQQVLVEGRMQNRTWDDQSGQKRYSTDYIIEQAYFADSRREAGSDDFSNTSMPTPMDAPDSSLDGEFIKIDETNELPF